MPTPYDERRYKRQQLIENLMHLVYQQEDSENIRFTLALALVLGTRLAERKDQTWQRFFDDSVKPDTVQKFCDEEILPRIARFAKTPVERTALVADLMKRCLDSGLAPVYTDLMREDLVLAADSL